MGEEWLEGRPAGRDLERLVSSRLNISQYCALAAKRTNLVLESIKYSITRWSKKVINLLYSALVLLQLEYCVQVLIRII